MIDVRHITLLITLTGGLAATLLATPFAQDPHYHQFADTRHLLGIPFCLDVLSNVGFALAGFSGLFSLHHNTHLPDLMKRWLQAYCWSLLMVAAGSTYYHLAPSNQTLVWDRLPMTLAFSLFFCLMVASHLTMTLAKTLLPWMMLAGAGSVTYWYHSEMTGTGDLRFYAAFQFLPMVLSLLMLLLFPSRWLAKGPLVWTLGLYVLAKLAEQADQQIFTLTGLFSGHSLKHLLAAAGAWAALQAARRLPATSHPVSPPSTRPAGGG